MYQQPKRLEFLDTIRGLAAMAVLLGHSIVFKWPPAILHLLNFPFLNILFNGEEAVAMFFVLSGFLLSRPYFISGQQGQPPRKLFLPTFYLRRFTRIWLPWFFAFVLSALAQMSIFRDWTTSLPTNEWFHTFWRVPFTFENALRQCLFIMHDPKIQLLNQDWSLGIELKASILLPLFIFLCGVWSPWSLLAVSTVWLVLSGMGYAYCSFILGVILARHSGRVLAGLEAKPLPVKAGLLMLGLLFYEAHHFVTDWLGYSWAVRYSWVITSAGCMLILLASMSSRRIQATLHLPPLIFLGRISYSIYLLQFIVILCVLPAWMHLLNLWGIQRTVWLFPLNFIASVCLTLGLATLCHLWVEKPCIELGHRLSRKIQAKYGNG